ncbi:MAG TPA: tape measure protein [Reyranellaceae bacterium]|nr:tape measure protein [Reyranellaceae bacterium]
MSRELELGIRITADGRLVVSEAGKAVAALKGIETQTEQIAKSSERMASTVAAKIGHYGTALYALKQGFDAVSGAARAAFDTINQFERLKGQLQTVTGGLENATAAFAALEKFAAETPYTLDQSVQAFTRLKALGLDATERSLRSFGNTASAMGKDLMQFVEAVADATTGEFERLKEFGIKASQEGEKVKLTFQGVTTEVTHDAQAIADYLRRIGEEKFGDAMRRQMETLPGAVSNLEDAVAALWRTVGDSGATQVMIDGLHALTDAAQTAAKAYLDVAIAWNRSQDSTFSGIARALNEVGATGLSQRFAQAAAAQRQDARDLQQQLDALSASAQTSGDRLAELGKAATTSAAAMGTSTAAAKSMAAAKKEAREIDSELLQLLDAIKTPQDEYNLRVDQAAKLLALGKINQEQYNLALTQYRDALYGSIQLQDAHVQAFEEQQARQKRVLDDLAQESELLKLSNEDREIRTRQIQANVAASSQEGQEIAKRVKENLSLKKAQTEVANASESWSQAMEQGVRRIDDSLQQMWEDWISGSSNAMDSVKKMFQSMLAELAHAAITRPIMMMLMGGNAGSAAGGSLGSSFGSSLLDLGVSALFGGGSGGGGLLSGLLGSSGTGASVASAGGGSGLIGTALNALTGGYALLDGFTSPALAAGVTSLGTAAGIGGNAINYLANAAYVSPYGAVAGVLANMLGLKGGSQIANMVLPTVGSIAGGVIGSAVGAGAGAAAGAAGAAGGAAAGASAGSVVPVIGTIIGAIIGAAASMLFKSATPKAYAGYRFGADNSLTQLYAKRHAGGDLKSLQQMGSGMAGPFGQLEEALGVELGQFDIGLKQKGGRFVLTGADEAGQFFRLDTKFKNKGKNNYIDLAFDQFLAALVKRRSVLEQFDDVFLRGALRFANNMQQVQDKFKEAAEFNMFVGTRTELSDSLEQLRQTYIKQRNLVAKYLYGNDLQYKLDQLNAAFADKFGQTADAFAGQIRQLTGESDGAAEALKSLKEQLKQIQVQSKELSAFAKKNGLAFTAPDIQAIGAKSVENLIQQLMTPFYESYLTPEEQLRRGILDRRGQVAALGLPGGLTAQNFRQRFESALPGLSVVQIETWMKAAKALSEIQKAEQELAAIRLQSANEARTAYVGALEREGSALVTARRQWLDLAAGFNQFRARLQTSELSPLSPGGRLEAARGRFESLATQARLGDLGAIAELQSSSETFLRASRDYYASSEQYYRDVQRVEAVLSETEALSVRHARLAEEQLSALLDMLQQLGSVETAAKLAGDVVAQATGTSSLYLSQAVQQSAGSVIAVQSAGLASQIGALTGVQASVQAGLSGVQALLVQGQASELAQTQSLVALAQQQVEQTRQAWEMAAEQAGSQVGVEQAQLEQLKLLNAAIAAIAGREAQALIPQAPPPPPPEPILPSIDQFRSGIPPAPAGVDPGRWQAAWAKRDAEHRAKFKASLWTKKSGFWDPSIGNTIIREAFLEARGYAQGGLASGWAVVGEEGPELVRFNRPGFVHTAAQSRELVSGEIVRELRQLQELVRQQTRDLVEIQQRVRQELRRVA